MSNYNDLERIHLQITLDEVEYELKEERKIVDRIWKVLGNPSYEELKGRSIHDLVENLVKENEELKQKLNEAIGSENCS